MELRKAATLSEVKASFESIEDNGDEWFSNLLASDEELTRWIGKGQVEYIAAPTTTVLLRQRHGCKRLYFANVKPERLSEDLRTCLAGESGTIITSVLEHNGENMPIKAKVIEANFSHYSLLRRVAKINAPKPPKKKTADYAEMDDLPRLMEILRKYFDPLVDQWPDDDEVISAIQNHQILVMRLREAGGVVALQSFERKGKTLYGRYLAAMEEYRHAIPSASILFMQCQRLHSDVRKIVGWIQEGNPFDVERLNRSMGLEPDGVTDEIFVRR